MSVPDQSTLASSRLEEFVERIASDPSWVRARDPGATLTFLEREQIQLEWAEAFHALLALAREAGRTAVRPHAGDAAGLPPAKDAAGTPTPAASWEAVAYFAARIVTQISSSQRLCTMLNERVPGVMDKPLALDRLARLALRAGRRMRAGVKRADDSGATPPVPAASEPGLPGHQAATGELSRMKKSVSLARLFVITPLLTALRDVYHFLARLLVSNGWLLYSKIINFYWRFPITLEQQAELRSHLQPGDLLVRRREVITTLFIPGYWTHMILYLGPYEEAVRFFDTPEVNELFRGMGYQGFSDCLARRHPEAVAAWKGPNFIDGSKNVVLEATANGVVLNSQRQALTANSIGALRMKISRESLALGVIDALGTVGRDFNYAFSFERYENLICTQVIATSFAEGPSLAGNKEGVRFVEAPIRSLGLRKHGVSPNEFVRQYGEEKKSGGGQFELVYFLQGAKRRPTVVGTEQTFLTTPDW